jgi:hypothetical protein
MFGNLANLHLRLIGTCRLFNWCCKSYLASIDFFSPREKITIAFKVLNNYDEESMIISVVNALIYL